MSLIGIVREQNLLWILVIQIVISAVFVYNGKNKTHAISAILVSVFFGAYNQIFHDTKLCSIYALEIILEYMIIFVLVYSLKRFAFYVIVCATHAGKIHKIGYKIFYKKRRFLKFMVHINNKVDLVRIKRGLPGMVLKTHPRHKEVRYDKNGFPKFKSVANIELPRYLWKKTREIHFYHASKMLYTKILKSSALRNKFTKKEIEEFKQGRVPSKYTWHHHQDKGLIQLVDRQIHANVNHKGGYSIWGKKE